MWGDTDWVHDPVLSAYLGPQIPYEQFTGILQPRSISPCLLAKVDFVAENQVAWQRALLLGQHLYQNHHKWSHAHK
jgi:hypothetical protein